MTLPRKDEPQWSRPTELRVHGIGNHERWSSLGVPALKLDESGNTSLSQAPELKHRVLLFNWSRMTRDGNRTMFWYLALPFTIMNMALAMRPARSRPHIVQHKFICHGTSIAMTVLLAVWLMATAEQTVAALQLPELQGVRAHIWAVVLAGAAHVALMAIRLAREKTFSSERHIQSIRLRVCAGHCAAVVTVVAAGLVLRPARVALSSDWEFLASREGGDAVGRSVGYLDPTAAITYAVLLFAMCVQLHGATIQKRVVLGDDVAIPLRATALTSLCATLLSALLVSVLSRAIPNAIAAVLSPFLAKWRGGQYDPGAAIWAPSLGPSDATVTLPLLLFAALSLIGVLFVIFTGAQPHLVGLVQRRASRRLGWGDESSGAPREVRHHNEFLGWAHRTVVDRFPSHLTRVSIWSCFGLVTLAALFARLFEYRATDTADPEGYPFLFGWVDSLSAAAAAIVLLSIKRASMMPAMRAAFAGMGDVVGFWPVSAAPLGARSYREAVCRKLAEAVTMEARGDFVLVGHSQGSVLAVWLVGHRSTYGVRLPTALVTCGSPLQSIYARLFPAECGDKLMKEVAGDVRWANFWRSSDPIASELSATGVEDTRLSDVDESSGAKFQGHSNYWMNHQQQEAVARHLSGATQA